MGKKIINKTLLLDGLTCVACEKKIENSLKKMEGIETVQISYITSSLSISYDTEKVAIKDIIKTIEQLGYDVKKTQTDATGEYDKKTNNQFIILGIIILGAYLIIKNTIGFNFIPEIETNMGYGILFVVGILSSLHCVAMCGGINLSLCVSYNFDKQDNGKFTKLLPSFMYNAGRVISYTIIGGIVGALGSVFSISNTGSAFISILAGTFMVIMGLNMLNIFPWLRKLNPHMPKIFASKIQKEKKNKGPFVVGILNGLMPCGPLQAMQLYALGTGSFIAGALSMFMFSLGTVPLMFAFGALGSMMSSRLTKNMIKASAVLVMVLGIAMLNRGIAFAGFSIPSFTSNSSDDNSESNENTSSIEGDVQQITTTLASGRYTPITVQVGIPVEWTISVEANDLNGCNNEIIIPEYDIEQKLKVGDNTIKFTPTESGKFGYSCWMGMIRSSITVTESELESETTKVLGSSTNIEGLTDIESLKQEEDQTAVDETGLPSGCCGF